MPEIGRINATWTAGARTEIERFIVNARAPGAVLSLFKNADDHAGARWSYAVLALDRVRALEAVMQTRGHPLLHVIDGVTVAISNVNHARELDGKVLDHDGPGYLLVGSAATSLSASAP
jgi:hypothetical protein